MSGFPQDGAAQRTQMKRGVLVPTAAKTSDTDALIAKRLLTARKKSGLTQSQTAQISGLSQKTISRLENNRAVLTVSQLLKLAAAYEISPMQLLGGRDNFDNAQTDISQYENIPSVMLLILLAQGAAPDGQEDLAVRFVDICVYHMLRTLYASNPHNSERIFSLDKDKASRACERIFSHEPELIAALIKADKRSSALEIPQEYSPALREFIRRCEDILKEFL